MTTKANKRLLRLRLAEAQNWRCAYCSGVMSMDGMRDDMATADHLVPRWRGGWRVWENTVAACRACNGARGASPCFWAFYLQRQVALHTGVWPPTERIQVSRWLLGRRDSWLDGSTRTKRLAGSDSLSRLSSLCPSMTNGGSSLSIRTKSEDFREPGHARLMLTVRAMMNTLEEGLTASTIAELESLAQQFSRNLLMVRSGRSLEG